MQWPSEGTCRCQEFGEVLGLLLPGQGMAVRTRAVIYPSLPGEAGAPLERYHLSITEDPGIPASALCLLPGKAGTTLTFCSSGHLLMKSPKSRGPGHPRQSLTILPPRHTCTLRCSAGSSQSTHLGRHSVADIHDGNVLCVWTLIETQIGLQRVLQLNIRAGAATPKRKEQRNKYIKSGETSFPLTQAPFP